MDSQTDEHRLDQLRDAGTTIAQLQTKRPGAESAASLRIQAVLYRENPTAIRRSAESVAESISALESITLTATIVYGDASPHGVLGDDELAAIRKSVGDHAHVDYRFFGENTGYGKGHNILAANASDDCLLFINPDIVFDKHCIAQLLATMEASSEIGIVEARQAPIENARWFDPASGDEDWATGACMLVRNDAFQRAGGFDSDTFFMYCEDVDFSWAVRRAGFRVCYQPAAIVVHPHRLSSSGLWAPNETERYHDALGKLLLAHKWDDRQALRNLLATLTWSDDSKQREAAKAFRRMKAQGRLPKVIDGGTRWSTFHGIDHTLYRTMDGSVR